MTSRITNTLHDRAIGSEVGQYLLLRRLTELFQRFDTGSGQRTIDQPLRNVHTVGTGQLGINVSNTEGATDTRTSGTE
ncbi:hypothetical protein D3C84_622920 [compost metagenome]